MNGFANYSGVLTYNDVEFTFVFDGKQLKLIPDEDIEKYNSFIPEWKRNSIVLINTSLPTNKFKFTKYLKHLMPSLERFPKLQKLYHKSDLYYITKDLKKSLSNIRYNLTFTSNPLITVPKDLLEKVQFKLDGLNELINYPTQLVEIMNLIEAARLEFHKENYNHELYRKTILDIHDLIDKLPDGDNHD